MKKFTSKKKHFPINSFEEYKKISFSLEMLKLLPKDILTTKVAEKRLLRKSIARWLTFIKTNNNNSGIIYNKIDNNRDNINNIDDNKK